MTIQASPIVTLTDGIPTTTSLAIAEGAEVDHASVIKLIRTYSADLEEFGPLGFEIRKGSALPHGGFAKATEFAILNEQQTTLLFTYMRNSEIVRAFKKRLVKEFYDLAHGPFIDPLQALNDPATMRGLLLTYTEKVIALEHKVDELKPQADALKRISGAEGSLNITESAKALGARPRKFFQSLHAWSWIYRRPGGKQWLGYQDKIQSGLLDHMVRTIQMPDGSDKIVEQVVITPKGLTKLAGLLNNGVAS